MDLPIPNPFGALGSLAANAVADAWTVAMLALWNAGLWLLRVVLLFEDALLTPDLSETGPGRDLYPVTWWIAVTLALTLGIAQFGLVAVRRDARGLGQLVLGFGQFVMVWAAWVSVLVAIIAAASGLTSAMAKVLLKVDSLAAWQPWQPFDVEDISDATVATVLGLMGVLLIGAAIGHALVMLTRGGALIVLATTSPIAAAGLVSDAGRSWFWKTARWTIAAAFSPTLMVILLGVGVQISSGVALGLTDSLASAVGTALPGVLLIFVGVFSPLALFKLLAFVDPGTSSGAAMRAGWAAQGGLSGLMSGSSTSSAASTTDDQGRSAAETSGDDQVAARVPTSSDPSSTAGSSTAGSSGAGGSGTGGSTTGAGANVGAALGLLGAGLQAAARLGNSAAVMGADITNQMGVGHNTYLPDFTHQAQRSSDPPHVRGQTSPATPSSSPASKPPGAPAGGGAGGGAAEAAEIAVL